MKSYEWILFDADETLFHFNAFRGLKQMFTSYGVDFSDIDYQEYQALNLPLWVEFQNGLIGAEDIKYRRFQTWGERLNVSPHELNKSFLESMSEISVPLEGAIELVTRLKKNAKLGIVTNGFIDLQETRLIRHGLKEYFDLVIVSEEVGVAKPNIAIFEHAHDKMNNPPKNSVLMVGDTLETDILGGINAGFDTCWLNTNNKSVVENIVPNYIISSLKDFYVSIF